MLIQSVRPWKHCHVHFVSAFNKYQENLVLNFTGAPKTNQILLYTDTGMIHLVLPRKLKVGEESYMNVITQSSTTIGINLSY